MKASCLTALILSLAPALPAQGSATSASVAVPAGLTESSPAATAPSAVTSGAGDMITITTAGREGMTIEELLGWWTEVTDRKFTYNEMDLRGKPKINIVGTINVKRPEADALFQSLLVRSGFALVPAGTPGANTWAVESIQHSLCLRQSATYLPEDRIPGIKDQAALLFMTTIQLKNVRVENIRSAMTQILTNRQSEFSAESPSSNSVTVISFGPTLAMLHSVVKSLDILSPDSVPEPESPGQPRPLKKEKEGSEGKD